MGWKIGAPSLKLNNAGTVSKHCGDFGSVAREALEEREGRDPDIDQTRAEQNRIEGFRTAAELQAYSAAHVDELRDAAGRKLRKDAVVMCATILKPPAAMMNKLPIDEQRRFLDDANEAFADIVGRENIKSRADHFDELGGHTHVFWEPMTEDGRLCAKEVHNLQFFGRVNRELPEKLRAKGWEIDDCEMYDAAKEEYEKQSKKNAGRSSVAFKADAEQKKGELLQEIDELEEALNAHAGPVERLQKVQGIEDRAKASKAFLGRPATVKLDKKDYDTLVASARAGAASESEKVMVLQQYDRLQAQHGYLQERYDRLHKRYEEKDKAYKELQQKLEASVFESIPLLGRLFTLLREFRQSVRDDILRDTIKQLEKRIQLEKEAIALEKHRGR